MLEIESEEELDKILQEEKGSLTILLGSLTWCRPCKTLGKAPAGADPRQWLLVLAPWSV